MKNKSKLAVMLALVAPLVLGTVGCSSGSAPEEQKPDESGNTSENSESTLDDATIELLGGAENAEYLNELYEAAQANGESTVVVYGTVGGDRDRIYDVFSEMFPNIKVETEFLSGSDLFARVNQEAASGKIQGDLIVTGDTAVVALAEADRLATFLPPVASEMDPVYFDEDGRFAALTVTPFGLTYNTENFSEAEVPGSWDEVIDPQFKGQLAWVDLTVMGPSLVPTSRLIAEGVADEAWLQALKAQDVHFTGKAAALAGVIASGEYPIIINYPYDYYQADLEKGAPLGFKLMADNNYVATNGGGILVDAPHENAAKLLFTWLYTPAAQNALAELGQISPMPNAPAPEGLPSLSDIPTVPQVPWSEIGELNKQGLELTQRVFG